MSSFAGLRVVVVGLGASGAAAARVLHALHAKVRVTEASSSPAVQERARSLRAAGIEVETGGHDLDALDADLAVVSPGIPPYAAVVARLHEVGAEVVSEIEIAYRLSRCDFLAVTGTNGKTTTTSLLTAMLEEGGIRSLAAGNIGLPAVEAVGTVGEGGAIALEVSSFQLAAIAQFRPKVAVILNIAEDHTDWHGSFEAYVAAKARIVENQAGGDVVVANAHDPLVSRIARRSRARLVPFSTRSLPEGGIGVSGGEIVHREGALLPLAEVGLPGLAGLEDTMAAAAAALEYGVDRRAVVRAIKGFRAPPHRLELVAEVAGVTFVDDSKATNPHAALTAVKGFEDVVLIAGGRAKGLDLSVMRAGVPPVRAVVAMGEAADEVAAAFSGLVPVERAADMDEAVRRAVRRARPGGSVLLSPGCASLDMFENYAARGEAFVRAVKALIGEVRVEEDSGGDA